MDSNDWLAQDRYLTPEQKVSGLSRLFPTFNFYRKFVWYVYQSSLLAKRGEYDSAAWSDSSRKVLRAIESAGVEVELTGLDHVRNLTSPCVFIGNHMSMFETIILPAVIQPLCAVTFVVKQSLLDYPVFRHVLTARDPIGVSRENPREDLKAVMEGGRERIGRGISVVVFPQTTRSLSFDPEQFNSIGVKLAARANVPVVPIALVTDAWGNGKWIKDLGPLDPTKRVRIAFGAPMEIEARGAKQHEQVIEFIQTKLEEWGHSASPDRSKADVRRGT